MISAPCGKQCEDCPMFGSSCEGCTRERSFSFAYRCKDFDKGEAGEGGTPPCKSADGKAVLCPLLVEKSMRPGIRSGQGPDTPVQ